MNILERCPLCSSKEIELFIKSMDYSTSKEKFNISNCKECGFHFTNPRPKESDIGKYYISDKYISHTNEKKGLFNLLYQTVRKFAVKSKTSLLLNTVKTKTHLDIGCGTGEFLNACKTLGIKTIGIEPSDDARSKAIDNYKLDVRKETNLKIFDKNTFNSISMWHVLEHVYDIHETVENLSVILEPNGYVIVAVPNHRSFDAKYYKKFWAAWDLPIHMSHFCPLTIEKLFTEKGFKLTKKTGMKFDAFYVSLLSNEYKTGHKNYIKGFLIGLISNFLALIKVFEYSSTIYIFKNHK